MADSTIPVDLFNPGEVFACLGFLESAAVLLGDAEGGFDWSDDANARFQLRAAGSENPFAVVLQFLAEATIRSYAPVGYVSTSPRKGVVSEDADETGAVGTMQLSESFPGSKGDRMALPIRLESAGGVIEIGHWADGSSREGFKLYAGNRTGLSIASAMLRGVRDKAKKKHGAGEPKTLGVDSLWRQRRDELIARPFDELTPMGGSFNLDPRGGWTALDAGYSPNEHASHAIAASPVVEILAACGLEHARPAESDFEKRLVHYAAWRGLAPPILARPALAGADVSLVVRRFHFTLGLSGKNKVVTFAREEKGD